MYFDRFDICEAYYLAFPIVMGANGLKNMQGYAS
jgi:hypothetical protein